MCPDRALKGRKQLLPLPAPEEYGRKIAEIERRRSGVPEILRALKITNDNIREVVGQAVESIPPDERIDAVLASLDVVIERMDGMPAGELISALSAVDALLGATNEALSQMAESLAARPQPEAMKQEPVELGLIEARMDRLLSKEPVIVETAAAISPADYKLEITERDRNGDIKAVDLKAVRH